MAFNSRQSNMFRSSQPNNPKTPGSMVNKKQKQQQQQLEHDLILVGIKNLLRGSAWRGRSPLQKTNDIIECLAELGINFTIDDLNKPTPMRVQYLFERFVNSLMGVSRESVEPIIQAATGEQEYPEAHYDSAIVTAFYSSLLALMVECGVRDFSFNDLTKPETERLKFILSNVINFLRYRGGKTDHTETLLLRGEQTREQIERLRDENELLAKRAADMKVQRKREEPALDQAKAKNKQLTEELRELGRKQNVLAHEVTKVKDEKQLLVKALQDQEYLIQANRQECQKLQPYIVDSPEQLQLVITDLGRSLQREREAVDVAERQCRALQTSSDSFFVVEGDVAHCIKLMEDCQRELIRMEECQRKLQRYQEQLHNKESEVKEIERNEEVEGVCIFCTEVTGRLIRCLSSVYGELSRMRRRNLHGSGTRRPLGVRRPKGIWRSSKQSTLRFPRSDQPQTGKSIRSIPRPTSSRKRYGGYFLICAGSI